MKAIDETEMVWPSSEAARSLASEAASEVQTEGEEEKTRRYPAALGGPHQP